MIIGYIPVELGNQLFIRLDAVENHTQGVVIVARLSNAANLINERLCHAWNRRSKPLPLWAAVEWLGLVGFLISNHEEQLIFNDRARNKAAINLGIEIQNDVTASGPVAA